MYGARGCACVGGEGGQSACVKWLLKSLPKVFTEGLLRFEDSGGVWKEDGESGELK